MGDAADDARYNEMCNAQKVEEIIKKLLVNLEELENCFENGNTLKEFHIKPFKIKMKKTLNTIENIIQDTS